MVVKIWCIVCEDVGGRDKLDGQRDFTSIDTAIKLSCACSTNWSRWHFDIELLVALG